MENQEKQFCTACFVTRQNAIALQSPQLHDEKMYRYMCMIMSFCRHNSHVSYEGGRHSFLPRDLISLEQVLSLSVL